MIHVVWKNPNSFRSHHLPSSPPSYHHPIAPSISPLFGMNGFITFKHLETYSFLLEASASTCFTRLLFHHPRTPPILYTGMSCIGKSVHCRINVSLLPCHYLLLVKNMAKV
ncbi:hypothetical protein LXL04_032189 [Taraxacum kok-saghyz]